MRAFRMALALAAMLVGVWFALGVRQAHDTARVTAILSPSRALSTAEGREVSSLLRAAGALNPDEQVNLLRGLLASKQGQPDRARQIIAAVTRKEPLNLLAWLYLARVSTNDPVAFSRALDRVRVLEPRVH